MHVIAILLAAAFCTEVSMSSGGQSTRQDRPGDSWIAITDYRNSDENERQIDSLLSAERIPFHLIRVGKGWSQRTDVMDVIVPPDREAEAEALLSAAADAGELERAKGTAR